MTSATNYHFRTETLRLRVVGTVIVMVVFVCTLGQQHASAQSWHGIGGLSTGGNPTPVTICLSALPLPEEAPWTFHTLAGSASMAESEILSSTLSLSRGLHMSLIACTHGIGVADVAVTLTEPDGAVSYLQPWKTGSPGYIHQFSIGDESGEYRLDAYATTGQERRHISRLFNVEAPDITIRTQDGFESSAKFNHFDEIVLQFQGFEPNSTMVVALSRDIPAVGGIVSSAAHPREFVHLGHSVVSVDVNGTAILSMEQLLPNTDDTTSGFYLIAACYERECPNLPNLGPILDMGILQLANFVERYGVQSLRWPNMIFKTFAVGEVDRADYLHSQDPRVGIIEYSPANDTAFTSDTLTLQVAPLSSSTSVTDISAITYEIKDGAGTVVHEIVDSQPPFCAFGGDDTCRQWRFADHDYSWPAGYSLAPGLHTITVTVRWQSAPKKTLRQSFDIRPLFLLVNSLSEPKVIVVPNNMGIDTAYSVQLFDFKPSEIVSVAVTSKAGQHPVFAHKLQVDNEGNGKVQMAHLHNTVVPGLYRLTADGESGHAAETQFVVR